MAGSATLTATVRHQILDVDVRWEFPPDAPVTVLFGPSGGGKTTLLRCLAGLAEPAGDSRVEFDGHAWQGRRVRLPARKRGIGLLFQDHALFPHLDVAQNVAYGLHRMTRAARAARVTEALSAVGAGHLATASSNRLSGGEAQRVALARAIAPRPRLLLLDEPLSALDTPTRTRLRTELRGMLRRWAMPTLLVTHDRSEAMALGDRVAVLIDGTIHQVGSVEQVFSRPATSEVAAAVDVENVAGGQVEEVSDGLATVRIGRQRLTAVAGAGLTAGTAVLACIRAEDIALEAPGQRRVASPRNHLPAVVTAITSDGALRRVVLDAGFPLAVRITPSSSADLELAPGSPVVAVIKAPAVHLIQRP